MFPSEPSAPTPTGAYVPDAVTAPVAPPAPPPEAPPGYELLERLGAGGMGVVYRAVQLSLKRPVALKFLRGGDLSRFRAEAEALGRLRHPHFVTVHEVGEHAGQAFCALEYLAGGSLADRLKEGLLAPRDAALLVEQLARAMHAAHEAGIIHRDLKPLNVLLTAEGQPKVSDFGLVKFLDTDSGLTVAGQVMGSPSYMPPEQADGRADVDHRADVYALGAILYECLTGRPPFRGASIAQTLDQVRTREPVSPRQLEPNCPRDLETIALKCLQKEPGSRYGSAGALAEDLARHLRGEPILARPLGRVGRAWRWCRRNPAVAIASAVALLALLAGSGASLAFGLHALDRAAEAEANERLALANGREAERQQKAAEINEKKAHDSEGREKAARALAERQAYVSDLRLVQLKYDAGEHDEVERLLSRHVPRQGQPDLRGFEWHFYRRRLDERRSPPGRIVKAPVVPNGIALSPDGRSLAVGGGDGTIRLLNVVDGSERMRLDVPANEKEKGPGGPHWLAFSPRGDRLAAVAGTAVILFDLATKKAMRLVDKVFDVGPLAFSGDGKRLVAVRDYDGGGIVVDTSSGKALRQWKGELPGGEFGPDMPLALELNADGSLVAEARLDGVAVWKAEGDEAPRLLRGHTRPPAAMRFLAAGEYLLSASPAEVLLFHVATGAVVRQQAIKLPEGREVVHRQGLFVGGRLTRQGLHLTLSPEGGYVALIHAAARHTDEQILVLDTVTGQTFQSRWSRAPFGMTGRRSHGGLRLAAGPYGSPLVLAGSGRELAILSLGQLAPEHETLPVGAYGLVQASVSPDGERYALSGLHAGQHTVCFWDARTHQFKGFVERPSERESWYHPVYNFCESPDGQRQATVHLLSTTDPSRYRLGVREARTNRTLWKVDFEQKGNFLVGVAFSPDGKTVLCASGGPSPRVFDAATGKVLVELPASPSVAIGFGAAPGRVLLQDMKPTGPTYAGGVVEWDLATRKAVRRFQGECGMLSSLAYSPALDLLAGGDGAGWLHLWKYSTGKRLHYIRTSGLSEVARVEFTPDGQRLAVLDTKRFTLWDPVLIEEVFTAPVREYFFVFTRDGRRVIGGFSDGFELGDVPGLRVRMPLWDARPLTQVLREEREARVAFRYRERTIRVKSQIVQYLHSDPALSGTVRKLALEIAHGYAEDPALLAALARTLIYDPSRPRGEYGLARHQLSLALQLHAIPRPVQYLEMLAAAHYRLGEWKHARQALVIAEQVQKEKLSPPSLAFFAMTFKRLGDDDRARAYLERARKAAPPTMRLTELAPGLKLAALLEEAERVVGTKAIK